MIQSLQSAASGVALMGVVLAGPALAGVPAIDIQSLSDAFATYQPPDLARDAVNKAIPAGTSLENAEAVVKQTGDYCWL